MQFIGPKWPPNYPHTHSNVHTNRYSYELSQQVVGTGDKNAKKHLQQMFLKDFLVENKQRKYCTNLKKLSIMKLN